MKYKGYDAVIEFDEDAHNFHGEVLHLRDVITFKGESVDELEKAFQASVDDYLALCAGRGEKPEKPYSGKLALRISPDLHRALTFRAKAEKTSVNNIITEAVKQYVTRLGK